jgi:hypothetical protein
VVCLFHQCSYCHIQSYTDETDTQLSHVALAAAAADAYSDTSFPYKMNERVAEPKKHVAQVYFILIMQGRGQCIEP